MTPSLHQLSFQQPRAQLHYMLELFAFLKPYLDSADTVYIDD